MSIARYLMVVGLAAGKRRIQAIGVLPEGR